MSRKSLAEQARPSFKEETPQEKKVPGYPAAARLLQSIRTTLETQTGITAKRTISTA
jgi:hypothetical protein